MTRTEVKSAVFSDTTKWVVVTILSLFSMFSSSYVAYFSNDATLKTKLSAVEQHVTTIDKQRVEDNDRSRYQLERIENKLDRLIERGMK